MRTTEELDVEKMNLLDFPDEILLKIFRSFNDYDLFAAANVCTRFERISKEAVARKYVGDSEEKYFKVFVYHQDGPDINDLHREFLKRFGSQETKENEHRIFKYVKKKCCFTKHVIIQSHRSELPVSNIIKKMSNLTSLTLDFLSCKDFAWTSRHYPQLESLCLVSVKNINVEMLKRLLDMNPQLKHLKVINCRGFSLKVIEQLRNHLNQMKSLEYDATSDEFTNSSVVRVENLESLKISTNHISTANVLNAFSRGSKMIQKLELIMRGNGHEIEIQRVFEHSIGLFDRLTELKVRGNITIRCSLIQIFVRCLPNLISFHLSDVDLSEMTIDSILEIFESGKQLKEVTLESEHFRMNDTVHFNLDFHRQFANIVWSRGSKTIFEIIHPNENILITEEKIVINGEMRHWVGYGAFLSQSNIQLFDLDEKVLHKICDYLDEKDQRTLYETSTKMKTIVHNKIKSQWFTVSDEKTATNIFNRFGEHITKLKIDMNTDDHSRTAETWKLISEYCSKQLIKLQLNNIIVDATGAAIVKFPKLSKLKVGSMISSDSNIFPLMECPKLTKLQFDEGNITLPHQITQLGISTKKLTTIRVYSFDDNTHKILSRPDDKCWRRMKEFTIEGTQHNSYSIKITNIVMRFHNLTVLNLVHSKIEKTNLECLFQSCSKLRTLTLETRFYDFESWQRVVQCTKENCRCLELIQLMECHFPYDHAYPKEIANKLPTIKLKISVRDSNRYMIKTYKEPKFYTWKPY